MQLAIDTSTTWTSVALVDGDVVRADAEVKGVNPGQVLVSMIDELLVSAGVQRTALTQIVVGVGPGPYTSTRVGVAVARVIGFSLGVDVVGGCSQDAIAAQFAADSGGRGDFVVATDARRREVYWARFNSDGSRVVGPGVGKPADVIAANHVDLWVGDGLDRYGELVDEQSLEVCEPSHPSAAWLARVVARAMSRGAVTPTSEPELSDHAQGGSFAFDPTQQLFAPFPLYLRKPDAVPAASIVVTR